MNVSSRQVLGGIVAILVAILVFLLPVEATVTSDGSAPACVAVMAIDGVLILLTISYASWHRILWASFLHPASYRRCAARSFAMAVGLVVLEMPLGMVLNYLALGAGYDPTWTFAFYLAMSAALLTLVLAGAALVRALVLAVLGVYTWHRQPAVKAGL